jgi:hypothetical protein
MQFNKLPLLVLLWLLLIPAGVACSSSDTAGNSPIDWRSFTIVPNEDDPDSVDSIEEMERIGGFKFRFPSYLPEGVDNQMELEAWEGGEVWEDGVLQRKGGPEESVLIRTRPPYTVGIRLTERAPPLSEAPWGIELYRMAGVEVDCDFMSNSDFLCIWRHDDMQFLLFVGWTSELATASQTPVADVMRQETLKVIRSLIEAPIQVE